MKLFEGVAAAGLHHHAMKPILDRHGIAPALANESKVATFYGKDELVVCLAWRA